MNIEIANRLVKLRKENGLSQEELAAKIGISRQAVSKWERAEASPDTDNLILLARLYGISLDALLATEEEILPPQAESEGREDPCTGCDGFPRECHGCSKKSGRRLSFWAAFPYPIVVAIVYLLLGFLGGWWHPGWLVFLTVPVYYCLVSALSGKE
ncbi:MAG: helix-turn-helix domain-containing protein [Oscillospiraceae bacterium]|jgi:transcriptional regulator with XRE-family HTH domain